MSEVLAAVAGLRQAVAELSARVAVLEANR